MKKLISAILMSMATVFCMAQTEPEFEFEPFVFNTAESTIGDALPSENAYVKSKAGASMFIVGIGKVKTYYYIDGIASSLKLNKSNSDIVVNTGGVSPIQSISIIKLELLKSKRRWKSGEVGAFTGASSNEEASVNLKYKKYSQSSVIISTKNFEPGEYVLTITNQMTNSKSLKVYTFCVQ